ncbi:MAG: c-type cytochrome domain-containing protein [Planctomycetota bacterium]
MIPSNRYSRALRALRLGLRPILGAALVLFVALPARAQDSAPAETPPVAGAHGLMGATRAMLIERCGECHTPASQDRKGKRAVSDIGDLALVRDEFVDPGNPDNSDLWIMIVDGEMPPPDSDVAPPTEDEMALLRAWIQADAPVPATGDAPKAQTPAAPEEPRWQLWLARSHPLWIHFPLALIPAALLAQLLSGNRKRPALHAAASFCLVLALLAGVPALASGWLHGAADAGDLTVERHRWLAVGTVAAAILALLFGPKPKARLLLLLLATGLGMAAGHFGGRLTYGADFFPW